MSATGEPTRRVFFALWPDEAMQTALEHATRKAVRASGGRPVATDSFHLTLAFLGSVAETRLRDLTAIASAVASGPVCGLDPISVTFNRVEHWHKPHLLCAVSQNPQPSAVRLANTLKQSLVDGGFAPDLKPFRIHVTLARKVQRVSRELHMHPTVWTFAGFSLMDSRTAPEGSVYSVLDSWALGSEASSAQKVCE